jgi:hypothetical protein
MSGVSNRLIARMKGKIEENTKDNRNCRTSEDRKNTNRKIKSK